MKSRVLIITLFAKDICLRGSRHIVDVGSQIQLEYDANNIQCMLLKDEPFESADIIRCAEPVIKLLHDEPCELEPEINVYIDGDYPVSKMVEFGKSVQQLWSRLFRGSSQKIEYHSKERCFIRVQYAPSKVEQLLGANL